MKKRLGFALQETEKIADLPQLREQLLKAMLLSSFLIGTVLFAFALIPVIEEELYSAIVVYAFLYIWMIVITFVPGISSVIRSVSWLSFFYILGTVNLSLSGFNVDSGLFFLTLVAMAVLIGGQRGGLISLGVSAVTIAITGYAITSHRLNLELGLPQTDPMLWIIGGTIYLLMSVLLTIALSTIIQGLRANLTKATTLTGELELANEALRQSEERYRTLVETSPDLILLLDLDGSILVINPAGLEMFRYEKPEDAIGNDMITFIAPEDHARIQGLFWEILNGKEAKDAECLALRRDATTFPAEFSASLVKDFRGTPQAVIVVGKDISTRKQVEHLLKTARDHLARQVVETTDQLQQTTKRLNELVLYSPSVIFSTRASEDFVFNFISENVSKILGFDAEQFIDSKHFLFRHIHPEDRERVLLEAAHQRAQERIAFEYRFLHVDGEYRWIHDERMLVKNIDGGPSGYVGSFIDITESKSIENALKKSEETTRAILEANSASVFMIDPQGKILAANESAAKRLFLDKKELLGKFIDEFIAPELLKSRKREIKRVFHTGKQAIFEDYRRGVWFENNLFPVFDNDGNVERVVIFAYDITARRQAEIALRESEERYRTLAEAVPDFIFIIDPGGRVQYVNSVAAKFIGLPAQKIIGQPRELFFPVSTNSHQEMNIREVLSSGKMAYVENESTVRDRTVWLGTWLVPLRDHFGKLSGVLGVSRDITKRRQAEAAMIQSRDQLEERVRERTADLLASQAQLRRLTNQVVTAQEEERHRLSRELHDDAGQALVALKYSIVSVLNELPSSHDLIRQRLNDAMETIDQTMGRIRSMAHSLRPPVLDVGGINLSLQEYCREFMERTRLKIVYRGEDLLQLPDEISISLYRFVQESLTNILKHAQATKAEVRLKYGKKQIVLSVSDDGHGLGDTSQPAGIGLLGIQERLDLLGGTLQVHSRKGRGTKLTACVPWPKEEE